MTSSRSRSYARLGLVPALAVALVLGVVALGAPAQAQKIKPGFFGMHDSRIGSGATPGVEAGSIRLWDSGTSWRQIETSEGNFDWSVLDAAVSNAKAAGLRPLLVLGQTPQFHATKPQAPGAYGPGASSMPRVAAWKTYVRQAAERYGTRIDYQVWNEPNVDQFWSGSVGQMAKLTAAAGQMIKKAAGRRATVVGPSFPLRLQEQRTWYKKYWASKVNRKPMAAYTKVVAANLYPEAKKGPEAQLKLLKFAKSSLPRSARRQPLWNTEINYGLLGGGTAKKISQGKQAAYVARTMALNAGANVNRMYWYAWQVGPIANTHLVQDDGSTLTKAGRAWGVARGWLVGTKTKGCRKTARGKLKGLYTCTVDKGRRETRRIYWKPAGREVTVTTVKSTSSVSTLAGDTTKKRGRTRIKVGKTPVMVSSRR